MYTAATVVKVNIRSSLLRFYHGNCGITAVGITVQLANANASAVKTINTFL